MFRLAIRNTLARKGRLLLTSIAVVAGCAFLSGVFVFTDTIRSSFNTLFANAFEKTDAFVRSSNVIEGEFGAESRDRLDESVLQTILSAPGVKEASGNVMGFARVTTSDGTEVGVQGPPKFGAEWDLSSASPWALTDGRAPSAPDEIVIDRGSSKAADIAVGDTVTVTAKGGARPFTVTGIATFAGSDTSGGATWALFTLPTAQEFVGEVGKLDAVTVVGDGTMSDEQLKASVEAALSGTETEVLTGAEITKENQSDIEQGLSFLTIFLTIFAAISLFVGSFIIFNVFSISAAQRQRENALLRAIGASRGQVTRSLFVEALAVGAVGGVLGFGLGVLLAMGILALLEATGFSPSESSLVIKPSAFLITLLVGVLVTLVCALVPAIRSGRVPPLAAMRDVSVDRSSVSRTRVVLGVVFIAVAVAATAAGIASDAIYLGPGVIALFVSLIVIGPVIVAPLARLITRPLRAARGVTGELAGRNAANSPKRTALTAAALGIGLALLIGVSTLGSSLKSSIRETIGKQFTGDFAVSTADQGFGGLPTSLADDLNALPEVQNALGIGVGLVNIVEQGEPKGRGLLVVEPEHAAALYDVSFTSGGWAGLDGSSILVSADKAERDDLTLGSTLDVEFQNRSSKTVTVAGIFDSDDFGNLIAARSLFDGSGTDIFDWQVLIQSAPGTGEAAAQAAIAAVTDTYPTAKLQTRSEFIDEQAGQVDGFLNFIYALLLMSVFIAVLGIIITLLLAVYERRRELGLMRAVGATRSQVRSSIRLEALVTALLGSVMGTGLGVALGWIVVKALEDDGLNSFTVSPGTILIFVVLAIVTAVVSAFWPARRAAKADILQAIATT